MKPLPAAFATCFVLSCTSCSVGTPPVANALAAPQPPSGERLAYVVGCVHCHHQTPKEIMNAPPLLVAQTYSLGEFETLMARGVTRDGRDLYAQGSLMGAVAREQLSHLTPEEVEAVHQFLQKQWTAQRAATEEAKIATFPPPDFPQK